MLLKKTHLYLKYLASAKKDVSKWMLLNLKRLINIYRLLAF